MPVSVIADPKFQFEVAEGATIPIIFRLRNRRTGQWLDVSGASSMQLEWEVDRVIKTPVIASPTHPDADWANGVVAVVVSPADLTAVPVTILATLTAIYGGPQVPLTTGLIEIIDRPGYVAP